MKKKSQISFEYVIIMGFITFTIIGILVVAFFYSNSTKGKIQESQLTNCVDKIISTAESVFYSGQPSRAQINCYLPDSIRLIEANSSYGGIHIIQQTPNGIAENVQISNVPLLNKTLTTTSGVKRIKIEAMQNCVNITFG